MSLSYLPDGWMAALRSLPARVGVLTGVCLIAVMVIALLAANQMPWLENLALMRLWVSYAAFILVMLIPVGRFWRSARRLFVCGLVAWALFSLGYAMAGLFFFSNLFDRLNRPPFMMFVQGALIYGGIAVAAWVGSLLAAARHHPIAHSRHRHY